MVMGFEPRFLLGKDWAWETGKPAYYEYDDFRFAFRVVMVVIGGVVHWVAGPEPVPMLTPEEAAHREYDRLDALEKAARDEVRKVREVQELVRAEERTARLLERQESDRRGQEWRAETVREHQTRLDQLRAQYKAQWANVQIEGHDGRINAAGYLARDLLTTARAEERSVARGLADWKRSDDGRDSIFSAMEAASSAYAAWARRLLKKVKASRAYLEWETREEWLRSLERDLHPEAPKPTLTAEDQAWTVTSVTNVDGVLRGVFTLWSSDVVVTQKGGKWSTAYPTRHGARLTKRSPETIQAFRDYVVNNTKGV